MDNINQLIQFLQKLQEIMPKLGSGGSGGQSSSPFQQNNPVAPRSNFANNQQPQMQPQPPSGPQAPQPGPQVNIPQSPMAPSAPQDVIKQMQQQPQQPQIQAPAQPRFGVVSNYGATLENNQYKPGQGMKPSGMFGGGQIQTMEQKVIPGFERPQTMEQKVIPGMFQGGNDAAKGIIGYAGPAQQQPGGYTSLDMQANQLQAPQQQPNPFGDGIPNFGSTQGSGGSSLFQSFMLGGMPQLGGNDDSVV